MEKEYVDMRVNQKKLEIVKLDMNDDFSENTCGQDEIIKPKLNKIIDKKNCYKCKTNKSQFLNRNEFICKECFLKLINHKFRSNLRAQCKIRNEDCVLVCVSGGNNSMAMLNMFHSTFNDKTSNRKLFFKLKVLYIDDSILSGNESYTLDSPNCKNEIESICKKFQFLYEVIPLESVLENLYPDYQIKFVEINNKISQIGSFNEDFYKILIRNLIFKYSLHNGFNKIVLGNSAQSLVNSTFGSIVKGRGFNLREDIGYLDDHYLKGKVLILKPMRDYLTKEILLYNHIKKIELIHSSFELIGTLRSPLINLPKNGNTTRLLKFFFDNLQDKMFSTVTTVIGTAEKLKPRSELNLIYCGFCLNYIDEVYNPLEIGSIDSIKNE